MQSWMMEMPCQPSMIATAAELQCFSEAYSSGITDCRIPIILLPELHGHAQSASEGVQLTSDATAVVFCECMTC